MPFFRFGYEPSVMNPEQAREFANSMVKVVGDVTEFDYKDVDVLAGLDELKAHMDTMVEQIKATKKLPGVDEILMPSERGDRVAEAAEKSGEVEIEDNLYHQLQKAAE